MGRIPEGTIQTIRDRIDLVELIGRHVALRRQGSSWWGLCPFHGEKSPSFHVHRERGFFHCFGCGASGNAFEFLIRHENLTFPEAVRSLAADCGVDIPETDGGEPGLTERIVAANEVAQRLYRATLATEAGAKARAYLERRGLDAARLEQLGIGYAPDRWDALGQALARERISAEFGTRAGLLKERSGGGHYDLLRHRVTFPIRDARGRIVAFGGRALGEDQEPKYLNSPETPLFRKREAFYGLPFALDPIRRTERAVVVEGYFDWIALDRAGVGEALATCGTALSEGHARALRRRVREVVLLFDGDEAGQRAALRALEVLLPQGLRVRAAALPAGADPDDFLTREGPDALRALVDAAPPALDLAIRRAVAAGCASPWQKSDAVAAVAPLLAAVPDAVERGEFGRRLALAAGVAGAEVAAVVRSLVRKETPVEPAVAAPVRPTSKEERRFAELVRTLVAHPAHASALDVALLRASALAPAWTDLIEPLLAACRETAAEGGNVMARLERQLGDEPRRHVLALLAEPLPVVEDASAALEVLERIEDWFEREQRRQHQHRLTKQIREGAGDPAALLAEKDARRRAALQGTGPG